MESVFNDRSPIVNIYTPDDGQSEEKDTASLVQEGCRDIDCSGSQTYRVQIAPKPN